jgi:uncharacterized protein (TIGR02453 family)
VFEGFGQEAFAWFEGLERDNSREYWQRTRDLHERAVREPLEDLLLELGGGDVKVFRQHRDLRFSRDRRPLKDRTYGHAGRLFVQLSARGLYAGTGMYRPTSEQLERYRAAVGPELEAMLAGSGLDVAGMSITTAPRGYPRDHPQIELLRRKQLIVGRSLPAGSVSREKGLEHTRGVREASAPVLAWLDARVYGSG